ncbi:negative regulator of sigma-B (phosphoserine phosphatase) [Oceanobacillus limi]|uniref:Negative regulator of sigma-B (Phosphoserine phosphatase) n=1 Tax=Oceanobacillus limi TaxID=930131 RepID=A0A1I0H748_9BACI|nr:SpoIIE family protein phosphatase [Oceanobacillus limi]SET79428.1 negative regulator of sigma-B (phosphoserine phosphatase) [Oceanobacillus limi]
MSNTSKVQVAVFQKAKQGNVCCGDSYFYIETENFFLCAIADGLGSGEYARESSQAVIDIIKSNSDGNVEQIFQKSNTELFGKRGVVLGILKINFLKQRYSFSSIGNIGFITVDKDKNKKRNIPRAGYLSGYKRPIQVKEEKLEPEMNFIMFTDGVKNNELSSHFYTHTDVDYITNAFAFQSDADRDDDTTLVAMRYSG